jgi:membrane protein YqaA with SNARE-associated domain
VTDPLLTTEEARVDPEPQGRRPHVFRRLYAWVLSWAESPHGTRALALIAFAESSFFPIPPDVLQMALSVSRPRRAFRYAAVSLAGSVTGAVVGWLIGWGLWDVMQGFFFDYVPGFTHESFHLVEQRYNEAAFLAIFGAAFTPIPFKIFTIASGVFHVKLWMLVLASILGRGMRFFGVATLFYFFGPAVKQLIERYFEVIAFAIFALGVLGFVAVKYLLR